MTTDAQHVTVAVEDSALSRVYGLPGDSLNGRADGLPDPVATDVARRIFE
jgi:hypothetical protein